MKRSSHQEMTVDQLVDRFAEIGIALYQAMRGAA